MWPSSPAAPLVPASIAPPNTRAAATPVPMATKRWSRQPRAARARPRRARRYARRGPRAPARRGRPREAQRGDVAPAEVRGVSGPSGRRVDETRHGQAYGTDAHPHAEVSGERPDGAHDGRWAVKDRSRTQLTPYLGAIGVDDQSFHHGAADVEPQHRDVSWRGLGPLLGRRRAAVGNGHDCLRPSGGSNPDWSRPLSTTDPACRREQRPQPWPANREWRRRWRQGCRSRSRLPGARRPKPRHSSG